MVAKVTNNAATTLASAVTAVATSILLAAGTGAKFPVLVGSDWFYLTLTNAAGAFEIVKVTARSVDTLTCVRGVDNTTALTWAAGDSAALNPCAALINELVAAVSVTEPYADATGTVDAFAAALTANQTNSVLYDGYRVEVGSLGGNTVAGVTFALSINGVANTAVSVVKFLAGVRSPLAVGDTNVGVMDLRYDLPNTLWVLMNPAAGAVNANNVVSKTGVNGSAQVPVGTTAQRDTVPIAGELRFNTDTASFEGHNGTAWGTVGGAGSTGGGVDKAFYENDQVITTNYTITAGKNAMTAGPLTINTGITVTVPTGSSWSII